MLVVSNLVLVSSASFIPDSGDISNSRFFGDGRRGGVRLLRLFDLHANVLTDRFAL